MADDDKNKPDDKDKNKPDPKPDTGDDEVAKWKALARKHEEQAKANAEAAKKLAELEEADKTELQKANDKAAQAERDAAEAKAQLLRIEVGADKGLTAGQAKRLVGSTRDELEKDADELLETFGGSGGGDKKPPGDKPKERLRGGGDPTDDEPTETNPQKLAESVPRL